MGFSLGSSATDLTLSSSNEFHINGECSLKCESNSINQQVLILSIFNVDIGDTYKSTITILNPSGENIVLRLIENISYNEVVIPVNNFPQEISVQRIATASTMKVYLIFKSKCTVYVDNIEINKR